MEHLKRFTQIAEAIILGLIVVITFTLAVFTMATIGLFLI